jgi:hypothetical protein
LAGQWTKGLCEQEERLFIRIVAIITLSTDFGLFVVGSVGLRYGMTMYPLLWTAAAMTLLKTFGNRHGLARVG